MRKIIALALLLPFVSSCVPLRSLRYLIPDLEDSKKFENVTVKRSATPFRFSVSYPNREYEFLKRKIDTALVGTKTNVFLVIKNDRIIYQYLSEGTELQGQQPSFSMAKSFVGTLVGIAVDRGQIKSTADPVIKYLPELEGNDPRFRRLSIQHLLDMRSGFDFNERSLHPFSKITRMYYGADLKKMAGKIKIENDPNTVFQYQSINTQILAMILEKVTGKPLNVLLEENLWQPLGAESDALWSLDDANHVKAFCCINATALDFAKLGRLYLNNGNWNGKQLVSKKWIEATTNPDTLTKLRYKNQVWACRDFSYFQDSISATKSLSKEEAGVPVERASDGRYFYAKKVYDYKFQGMFNQAVYVNPQNKVIIVRLGGRQKKINFHGFIQEVGRSVPKDKGA